VKKGEVLFKQGPTLDNGTSTIYIHVVKYRYSGYFHRTGKRNKWRLNLSLRTFVSPTALPSQLRQIADKLESLNLRNQLEKEEQDNGNTDD
jgi:hypothetical protein